MNNKNPFHIVYIPEELLIKNPELCKIAVSQYEYVSRYIPLYVPKELIKNVFSP
jgi:hypothetical protein